MVVRTMRETADFGAGTRIFQLLGQVNMLSSRVRVFTTVLLSCAIYVQWAVGQTTSSNADTVTSTIVVGHPFSAVKYSRIVRVLPAGKTIVISEGHKLFLARDSSGLIFMATADRFGNACDLPSLGDLPLCDYWTAFLLNIKTRVIWHWSDGETADRTQLVLMDLRDDQIAEATERTSTSDEFLPGTEQGPRVSAQDLGEKSFEGIKAKGVRTVVAHEGVDGKPRMTIHEVWFSSDMRLVIRVVDGDPTGDERISGLDHISLAPEPSLFRPPEGRTLRHWKDNSEYADPDIDELSQWFVK